MQTISPKSSSLLPTDDEVVARLRMHNERITRDYFYGYCTIAYKIFCAQMGISSKDGFEFYSLAHEYYIRLDTSHFKQLERRKKGISLRLWMMRNFRYFMRERLEKLNQQTKTQRENSPFVANKQDDNETDDRIKADVRRKIDQFCRKRLGNDPRSADLLRHMFIDGYKGKDVATELGITPAAVSQRLHNLIEKLRPYFLQEERATRSAEDFVCYGAAPSAVADEERRREQQAEEAQRRSSGFLLGFMLNHFSKPMSTPSNPPSRQSTNARAPLPDYSHRITPPLIEQLADGQVFVFGSNLRGLHGGGAACTAFKHFGAVWGQGEGLQGRSYGIPTMQGGVETIRPYVNRFLDYARCHPELTFLVTPIGCGIAGFLPQEIAPLFAEAIEIENIHLPQIFWDELAKAPCGPAV